MSTESFESVMDTLLNGFTHDVRTDELSGSYKMIAARLDRLQAAHDREIRDTAQQQYHRGYEDGRHSMDAEHRAISMRLRGLRFDGGSHENLSRIAYAIYPCATGWTCESAAGLRDKLVDLLGGVSDDTCGAGCCCAAADCDGRDSGEHAEVSDGGTADDCAVDSRGGDGGGDLHMAGLVTYDVLDNERRKAIAELRKCDGGYTLEWDNIYKIFDALGVDYVAMPMAEVYENLRDRLIHLLGGDQPSGIDVMNGADLSKKSVDAMSKRALEECEVEGRITDELREWMDLVLTADDQAWDIADRIDERAKHDRDSDQLRIEKLVRQRDETREERDELRRKLDKLYRRESTKSVVNGLIAGTYTKAEAIKRIEQIYGDD